MDGLFYFTSMGKSACHPTKKRAVVFLCIRLRIIQKKEWPPNE